MLPVEMRREMTAAFIRTLVKIDNDALLTRFLDDLLTPTEKIMLSKRLMAAVLLQRGYSYGAVCRALKLSKATVFLIQRELLKSGEGYRRVFERFFKESRGERLLKAIDRFLDAITLPVKGSPSSMRRWKRALRRL
jgi:uncharacterized protein YerC